MARRPGITQLNVDIPTQLYIMYSKLCIDLGISKAEGIIRYLEYLQKQSHRSRKNKALHEGSDETFKLDEETPK